MEKFNPLVIPRNHKVEEALDAAINNNLEPVKKLIKVLSKPYTKCKDLYDFQLPSLKKEKYQTFCGT